jgi:hypothetical protein
MIMEELEIEFNEWLKDRPEIIKLMAEKLKPWLRYRLKTTGQHCNLYSYSEDGTVTVTVNGHDSEILNHMNELIEVNVFGVSPDDLEPLAQ